MCTIIGHYCTRESPPSTAATQRSSQPNIMHEGDYQRVYLKHTYMINYQSKSPENQANMFKQMSSFITTIGTVVTNSNYFFEIG